MRFYTGKTIGFGLLLLSRKRRSPYLCVADNDSSTVFSMWSDKSADALDCSSWTSFSYYESDEDVDIKDGLFDLC